MASKTNALRSELQSSGVSLVDCLDNVRQDIANRMVMVDMLVHAMDHPHTTFILISGHQEFAYVVSILRLRKFEVVVISTSAHPSLTSQASISLDWDKHIMDYPAADSSTTSSSPTTRPVELNGNASPIRSDHFKTPPLRPVDTFVDSPILPSPQPGAAPAYTTNVSQPSEVDTPRPTPVKLETPFLSSNLNSLPQMAPPRPSSAVADIRPISIPHSSPSVIRAQSFNAPKPFFPPPPEFPSATTSVKDSVPKSMQPATIPPSPPLASTSSTVHLFGSASSKNPFDPLINVLEAHKASGQSRPLRSIIGQELAKSVYERAGAQSFAEYTAQAEQHGLVEMGGNNGLAWISLKAPSVNTKKAIPVIFQPLVDAILSQRARGISKPLRSVIGSEIVGGPSVYAAAGVKQFRQYTALAEQNRIIQMGGAQGEEWIMLHSSVL
ncbi:NYN domain-containing protein [Mycena indigotica]|uniref:NYN domain-containing protein n=1 Tax=Mycena indigotica TaxID=2126181 RepID=A0A8H6SB68_9AGAR|nr:NYN domain-containing protein [Mycena indigotica]KAF7295107.1 NYN domain-containing protein [Mycena indigotica]